MSDFFDQARILAVIHEYQYEWDATKPLMSYNILRMEKYFKFMDDATRLVPMLEYLLNAEYLGNEHTHLYLTGKGMRTTHKLFREFLEYIKKYHSNELSGLIKTLNLRKGNMRELIRDSYFYGTKEPPMEDAFNHYLDEIVTIENVDTYEIDVYNLCTLIEDIFLNLYAINKLFENKFKYELFSPPIPAQTTLSRATTGKEINLTHLVGTLGSIIDRIHSKEINSLLGTSTKIIGSINKIQALLDKENISYDSDTFKILHALHDLRNTTFPIHEAGSKDIQHLQKLNIGYPIEDYKDAAAKLLQSFNSCLLGMRLWFK
jgi:hypothetical protein